MLFLGIPGEAKRKAIAIAIELCMRWLSIWLSACTTPMAHGVVHADDSDAVLQPNPSFIPKVMLPQFINQSINLATFQSASQSVRGSPFVSFVSL